jgi:endoglucanase
MVHNARVMGPSRVTSATIGGGRAAASHVGRAARAMGVALLLLVPACDGAPKLLTSLGILSDPPAVLPVSPNQEGEWLHTEKNRLLTSDGKPFHGRGANIHDTRSCDACSYEKPHPEEVIRRIDELVDVWHADFMRLDLESYAKADKRDAWKNALEDEAYLKDLVAIVHHIEQKPGVYVELSVWHDPSLDTMGWPTDKTRALWEKLVHTFAASPRVMFGVVTEPEQNQDGKMDAFAWDAINKTVETIRAAEGAGKKHIVVVQGTRMWSRRLDYYVTHPITAGGGLDVAYESHAYDDRAKLDALFDGPAKTLPVIIGEFGPVDDEHLAHMTTDDCAHLMDRAEELEIPYLAWTFHMRCPPNLLVDKSGGTCGVGMPLEPTPWGMMLKNKLAQPYGAKGGH